MQTVKPLRVAIPVSSFPHRSATAPRWTGRRLIGTVLRVWLAVAAMIGAIVLALARDLRS